MVTATCKNTKNCIKEQNDMEKNKEIFYKFLIVSIVVAFVNIVFYENKVISYGLIICEMAVLIYELLKGRYAQFLAYYIIFLSLCLEFATFIGSDDFVNIKNVRFLGLNLGIWLALPCILLFLLNFKLASSKAKNYKTLWSIGKFFIFINIIAFLVGFIMILLNDNNIRSMKQYFEAFLGEMYNYAFFPIFLLSIFSLIITFDKKSIVIIPIVLQAILFACVIQRIFAIIFSVNGQYGGNNTISGSSVSAYATCLIIFIMYPKNILFPKISGLIGVIGTVIDLMSGGGGKGIILIFVCLIIIELKLLKSKNKTNKILAVVFPLLGVISVAVLLRQMSTDSEMLSWKLYNVKKLFAFGPNWLNNLPHSPKVRAGEFINIFIEFAHKPWLIFTGKGYIGTVLDYSDIWQSAEISYGAFTDAEWEINAFYSMHEISSVILTFGLLGVILFVKGLVLTIKNYSFSVWIVIGFYWLFLFYGFSFTIGVFGCAAFFYALYEIDVKRSNIKNAHFNS